MGDHCGLTRSVRTFSSVVLLFVFMLPVYPTFIKSMGSSVPAGQASVVVAGEVLRINCRWENDLIYSYVTISVRDVRSGSGVFRGEEITLKHIGGGVDDRLLWRSDQPYFYVGELVQLSLRQEDSIFVVVGGPVGKLSLDSALQPIVERTAAGYRLFWYHTTLGWKRETDSPGSGWYGPARWGTWPVTYYVDTRNMPSGAIAYIQRCYQTWEDDVGSDVDYTYGGARTDKEPGTPSDGVNLFAFRYIDGSGGTLAQATTWYTISFGNYDSLRCTEGDVTIDTGDPWSAAETCPSDKFDLQGVGTHEVGHITCLADLYDSEDTEMTMYGYASKGETKKRDLAWGDQAGVSRLYPTPFDFSLGNSGGITVTQGSSDSNMITVTLLSGTTQSVSLSASGLPSGAAASFNPALGNPTFTSDCTIATSSSTPMGSYTITVTGTDAGLTRTTQFTLTVNPEKGSCRFALDASPKPGYVGKPVRIFGVLYGSWRCISGVVIGKPVEITTGWGFKAVVTTNDRGEFSIDTTAPSTVYSPPAPYPITATFYEDEDLTGTSTTIWYEIISKIPTVLTVQIISVFQGYGVPPAYGVAGYLKTKDGGLPIAGKTIHVTVRTAMGENWSYECTTDASGYYKIPSMFTDRPKSATAEFKGDSDYEPSTASTS